MPWDELFRRDLPCQHGWKLSDRLLIKQYLVSIRQLCPSVWLEERGLGANGERRLGSGERLRLREN